MGLACSVLCTRDRRTEQENELVEQIFIEYLDDYRNKSVSQNER